MGNIVENAIDKGLETGYEKILDLILDAVGVPSFLKKPLKKFISAVAEHAVTAASDKLLVEMGEIPQATPSLCSKIASNILLLLRPYRLSCDVYGLNISIKISGKTREALNKLVSVLKGGKND